MSQNDTQELKQVTQTHNSHFLTLSQACSNNLTGGPLIPLDLCEVTTSSPEVLALGYQGSHTNGLPIPSNQGSFAPVLSNPGANSMIQGFPSVVNSPSFAMGSPTRDSPRYGVQRLPSLSIDDQQRMQQYRDMVSSGSMLPSSGVGMPGSASIHPNAVPGQGN